jgi:hypothetical protein
MFRRLGATAILVLAFACGSESQSIPDPRALAEGAIVKPLAGGMLASLPTGGDFVRVIKFVVPASYSFPSSQHVPVSSTSSLVSTG